MIEIQTCCVCLCVGEMPRVISGEFLIDIGDEEPLIPEQVLHNTSVTFDSRKESVRPCVFEGSRYPRQQGDLYFDHRINGGQSGNLIC